MNDRNIIINQSGFALPYILVVCLLIYSVLLCLFAITFIYNKHTVHVLNKKRNELACYSALQMDLTDINVMNDHSYHIYIDSIPVVVERRQKGFFFEVTVTSHFNNDSSRAVYTIANCLSSPLENALIISRPNLRAYITGNTKISGNILASSNAFIPGSIFGIKPSDSYFHSGKIIINNTINPKLYSEEIIRNIDLKRFELQSASPVINNDLILDNRTLRLFDSCNTLNIYGDLIFRGKLSDSQLIKRQIIVHGKTIFESNSTTEINLEIYSDSTIFISNAHLENVFLCSEGNIYISEASVLKNVQLLSNNNISINNSDLLYPSVTCIFSKNRDTDRLNNQLTITRSKINGTLMLLCQVTGMDNNKSIIKADNNSIIQGLVYSENNVESHARVKGIIYTYNFWYYKEPTEYLNWLVETYVNRNELSPYFLLPVGFNQHNDYDILSERWIY